VVAALHAYLAEIEAEPAVPASRPVFATDQ